MEPTCVVLGPGAASLRRQLGPSAWCALEALVARSRPGASGDGSAASVRIIAEDLGVATNTAHRALRTLRAAGLVEPSQSRHDDGRFALTSYRLNVPSEVLHQLPKLQQRAVPQPEREKRSASAVHVGEQLVLIPSN